MVGDAGLVFDGLVFYIFLFFLGGGKFGRIRQFGGKVMRHISILARFSGSHQIYGKCCRNQTMQIDGKCCGISVFILRVFDWYSC